MARDNKTAMKWFVTIVASILFIFSTIYRTMNNLGADTVMCTVYVSVAGLVWGANIVDYFKKPK